MTTLSDLREIERRAYRSVFKDGLWDIYYGLLLIAMALFMYRPESGYSAMNILLLLLALALIQGLLSLGKRYITVPRMGQFKIGETRKRRNRRLAVVLGVIIVIQIGVVLVTISGWANPDRAVGFSHWLDDPRMMDLVVASIGALFVGAGVSVMVHIQDYQRGYYVAVLMMLAVFLMIYLNQPLYPILLGVAIVVPGIVLFVRFLRDYPLPKVEDGHPE